MDPRNTLTSNFAQLWEQDEQLLRLGLLAERYFTEDPNNSLLKLRQFAESLIQNTASHVGLYGGPETESQYDSLRRLRGQGVLPPEIFRIFDEIRRTRNTANRALAGNHRAALGMLQLLLPNAPRLRFPQHCR